MNDKDTWFSGLLMDITDAQDGHTQALTLEGALIHYNTHQKHAHRRGGKDSDADTREGRNKPLTHTQNLAHVSWSRQRVALFLF